MSTWYKDPASCWARGYSLSIISWPLPHHAILSLITILHVCISAVAAKSVFAHVVVGNTAAHTVDTWTTDITLAADAGIDAFVLNCGYTDSNTPTQIANAFTTAESYRTSWPASEVVTYLNQYKTSSTYFLVDGAPFASMFEGTGNVGDWAPGRAIRGAVGGVFFMPDWTSLGAGGIAADLANIEGFFSWDMWSNGAENKTDLSDVAWIAAIDGNLT
ncbi:glycosyl hydrolase family 71-domain-containing protein [Calycina marina]|uniref:Glycosyl hydrolase family 71-domain-containing protein n=1 Tax=Calycina marina TaxID=1763456 RepID=A0A9P7Z7K9_9HELO|nr:glycosyl hydrolase family 71-domain-containing protein [Calycina marina]